MRGLAEMLDVHMDEATTDLQRLTFVSRRPKGRKAVCHIIAGRLLDWREITPVEKPAKVKEEYLKAAPGAGPSGPTK